MELKERVALRLECLKITLDKIDAKSHHSIEGIIALSEDLYCYLSETKAIDLHKSNDK